MARQAAAVLVLVSKRLLHVGGLAGDDLLDDGLQEALVRAAGGLSFCGFHSRITPRLPTIAELSLVCLGYSQRVASDSQTGRDDTAVTLADSSAATPVNRLALISKIPPEDDSGGQVQKPLKVLGMVFVAHH